MKKTFLKIYNIIGLAEQRRIFILFILMIVGMLLETLGIGLVIPAIALMMQDDLVDNYPAILPIFNMMGNPEQKELIVIAMLGLVVIYLIKNLFLAFLAWKQTYFAFEVQANISQRLFLNYLRQPYTFHLQRNSAELIRNVTGEVGIFTAVLTSTMMLCTEVLVLIGVSVLLFIVEPLGALIAMIVLGGSAWGFHRITRERISTWGVERQLHDGLRIQHLQQGLGGVKDVKLLGRESDFLLRFNTHNINSARVGKLQGTLQQFPKLIFEWLAVAGIAILVLTMLMQGYDMSSIIPTLGLFAVATFRLMPSVNRVLHSVQQLRYTLPVVSTLYEEINLPSLEIKNNNSTEQFYSELNLSNVTYHYPESKVPALDDISINIHKGKSVV